MDEARSSALRNKKDSSMRVALNLVKEGAAEACVSAGNTGAMLAGALVVAVLSTALPLSLEFEALKRMTARAYGVMVTLEMTTST